MAAPVQVHLVALRTLLESLNPEQVAGANSFWSAVRKTITEQSREIEALQTTVQDLRAQHAAIAKTSLPNSLSSPDRPVSSASVYELRHQVDDVFTRQALEAPDGSTTVEEIVDLD